MTFEDSNGHLVKETTRSIVLSRPGDVLTRMTLDVLPFAVKRRDLDNEKAAPSFARGMKAYELKSFSEAIREFFIAAELGHREAQFRLAVMYLQGDGHPVNHSLAYQWFHRAAEQGHSDAMNKLGWMCEAGFGVARDHARAVNWFRQAAERGHLEAQFNLAAKYDNGEGVVQNYAEAARWYRLAAEQGLADARFFLARALETGEGLPKDIEEAIDWYILAVEQGHKSSKVALWGHALAERYRPEDEEERIFIERLGVELGHPLAEWRYAFRLICGDGVEKDVWLAVDYYRRSARQGFDLASEHLSVIEELGPYFADYDDWKTGFKKSQDLLQKNELFLYRRHWMFLENGSDDVAKISTFRIEKLRAEMGDKSAFAELAFDYYLGWGTAIDYSDALKWFQKGAGCGDGGCYEYLGRMYLDGEGVSVDEEVALKYFDLAAECGRKWAQIYLARLLLRLRNDSKSIQRSISLLTKLATAGDANAQFDLGYLYGQGCLYAPDSDKKVPISHQDSMRWYREAAIQGSASANFNLGLKYRYGQGVERDLNTAFLYYKASAELGSVMGCKELEEFYREGMIFEKDLAEANKWRLEAKRLKSINEGGRVEKINTGLLLESPSARRIRLGHKRSLQRKASEMIGKI